ncbi:MAG: GHKL domain-containing protein [Lachnospiraceae bacterium]|nr:GHKL domain-containing protein [Lachnospiraceae bacterium]
MEKPTELYSLAINAIMLGIVVTGLRKCKLKKLSDILNSKERLISISLLVTAVSAILFFLTSKQSNGFSILYYTVLGMCVILIGIVAVDIGKNRIKVHEAEAELRQYRLYAASFRNLIDDIRARQHEFDNHINTVYSQHYLYKSYEELVTAQKKYCQEITGENRYNKLLSKGNPVILCFLYGKFSELEKRGIEITYKVVIGELEGGVPVHKIVELLGNLLNNAADAVKANGTDRISLTMVEKPEAISIEVSNESEKIDYKRIQDFFKKGYSEKGRNRGYGLYNVKKICEEYRISISCENRMIENKNWIVFGLLIKKPL